MPMQEAVLNAENSRQMSMTPQGHVSMITSSFLRTNSSPYPELWFTFPPFHEFTFKSFQLILQVFIFAHRIVYIFVNDNTMNMEDASSEN
jgi:hypothetical protein